MCFLEHSVYGYWHSIVSAELVAVTNVLLINVRQGPFNLRDFEDICIKQLTELFCTN